MNLYVFITYEDVKVRNEDIEGFSRGCDREFPANKGKD